MVVWWGEEDFGTQTLFEEVSSAWKLLKSTCGCRLCQDELLQGRFKVDRAKTQKVMRLVCKASSLPIEQNYSNCEVQFSDHYGMKCKFWPGGSKGDQVYRWWWLKGLSIGKELWAHCGTFATCAPKCACATHRCREKIIDWHWPIYEECLASSAEHIYQLANWGHAIHRTCLLERWKLRHSCPTYIWEPYYRHGECLDKRVVLWKGNLVECPNSELMMASERRRMKSLSEKLAK